MRHIFFDRSVLLDRTINYYSKEGNDDLFESGNADTRVDDTGDDQRMRNAKRDAGEHVCCTNGLADAWRA